MTKMGYQSKIIKNDPKLWEIMIAGQLVVFRPKEADLGRKRADRTKIELKSNSSRRQVEVSSGFCHNLSRVYFNKN